MSGRKSPSDQARFRDGKVQVQERLKSRDRQDGKVECLGMVFDSEEERRAYFLEELRKKLQDPEFRKIPGFPKGDDEAILRLSDPPYYTACPNPFVGELMASWEATRSDGDGAYRKQPFSWDVAEGKNDPLLMAHTYHTKVPYRAIARYIMHYTRPGDIVLDSFCGTGMTGVAAQLCVAPDDDFRTSVEKHSQDASAPAPAWGPRHAILVDLSPFATFLARNFNQGVSPDEFVSEAEKLIYESENAIGWVYESGIQGQRAHGRLSYGIWSEVYLCECGSEIPLWRPSEPVTLPEKLETVFRCHSCGADTSKAQLDHARHTYYDDFLGHAVTQNKYELVMLETEIGDSYHRVPPTDFERKMIERVASADPPAYVPTQPMMFDGAQWGDKYRAGCHHGITHAHHFWTRRNLLVLSDLFRRALDSRMPLELTFLCTSFAVKTGSRMHNVAFRNGQINLAGQGYNALQIQGLSAERNLHILAANKIQDVRRAFELEKELSSVAISTASATCLAGLKDNSIDYVFVDPPFGSNIAYAELSFLYECWLQVFTNQAKEAIVSGAQSKSLNDYQELMLQAFKEIYRVLKSGRWLTVAFHNSRNSVWTAIQEALGRAGFVVADVRVLDKGQGTYNQMTAGGAVEKDLVISAYKPESNIENLFVLSVGSEEGVWRFVRSHLEQLPVFVAGNEGNLIILERQAPLLFDRVVVFHVQKGITLPLSAADFYEGLSQRLLERDGMYFLPEQVAEYDRKRRTVKEVLQLQIVVTDEASAIQWLRQELTRKPQTFQDLHPKFLQEIAGWQKHEKAVELRDMLRENFVQHEDREERGRWHVPDPRKAGDLERVRERELLREFAQITSAKGRVKQLRTEAARVGFRTMWEQGDYKAIVDVAGKLPTNVVEEDPHLLMYLDLARSRLE